MRALLRALYGVALIAATAGCSGETGMHRIRSAVTRSEIRIEPGVTTQDQVRSWFGEPDAVRVDNLGAAEWGYQRDLQRGRLRRTFERIDRWVFAPVHRFWNQVVFYPPMSAPVSAHPREQLSVSFGPDGLVNHFAYRRAP